MYETFGCFKQPPVNVTLILVSEVEMALILSLDNPLDFHSETYSRYYVIENALKYEYHLPQNDFFQ